MNPSLKDLTGRGPFGVLLCGMIFIAARVVEDYFNFPKLPGAYLLHYIAGVTFLFFAFAIFFWALRSMPLKDHNQSLTTRGIYKYVRHPRYTALVFFVYPAACFLSHSVAALACVPVAYLAFRYAAFLEEKGLIRRFGDAYLSYKASVPAFVPQRMKKT